MLAIISSYKFKKIILFLFLAAICNYSQAARDSYELSVRELPNGEYEAVINYSTNMFCFTEVKPATSVEISGSDILIKSPDTNNPIFCFEPVPPIYEFEATAYIGPLEPGIYTVSWDQPRTFALSISFNTMRNHAIPSGSPWAIFLLALGMLAVAGTAIHTRSSSAPP